MLPRGATAYKKYTPLALANPAIARGLVEGFCYVRFHAILVAPRTDWLWPNREIRERPLLNRATGCKGS